MTFFPTRLGLGLVLVGIQCSAAALGAGLEAIPQQDGSIAIRGPVSGQIRFLHPNSFHLTTDPRDEEAARLAQIMVVKSDAEFPAVPTAIEHNGDQVRLSTSALTVILSAGKGHSLTLSVWQGEKPVIRRWEIFPEERKAWVSLQKSEEIYGFGDKRGSLDQRGNTVHLANADAFDSAGNSSYKNIPFYRSSEGYGIFFHNYTQADFDIGKKDPAKLSLRAPGGNSDFYVFLEEDPKQILSHYTEITGRSAMLPKWYLGYQQGRAGYQNCQEGLAAVKKMRADHLPVDAVYFDDWDESVDGKCAAELRHLHVRTTLGYGMPMVGDFTGAPPGDKELRDLLESKSCLLEDSRGAAVIEGAPETEDDEDPQATNLIGYVDYFNPECVKTLFERKYDKPIQENICLGMADYGELSNITDPSEKHWPSNGQTVDQTRNLFSLAYGQSVISGIEGHEAAYCGRETGLVRPGTAGSQRLACTTTMDSTPTYESFRNHFRALLNLSNVAFSCTGFDAGGWDSKGPDDVYARWFGAAAFNPYFWSHGQGEHEPYAHGPVAEAAARELLNLRYRLLPFYYSAMEESHRTGVPVLRPFDLQEPGYIEAGGKRKARDIDDEVFVGDTLLVAPLFNKKGDRDVSLPKGYWYDLFDEKPPVVGPGIVHLENVPFNRVPAYVRAGAILPEGPVMQHAEEQPLRILTVNFYAYPGAELKEGKRVSRYSLYEDDGTSAAYTKGAFQRTDFEVEQAAESVHLHAAVFAGDASFHAVSQREYAFRLHGVKRLAKVIYQGQTIPEHPTGDGSPYWATDAATGDLLVHGKANGGDSVDIEVR